MKMFLARITPRLILAMGLPFAAGLVQWIFWSTFQPFVWFLFYPAVFFSSWLGGLPGGLVATLISELLVIYFFIPPQLSWEIQRPETLFSVFTFAVMGIFFSFTHDRLHKATRQITQALDAVSIANQQLQTANAEITRLYDQTRELDKIKSQFFANVSHELRTPLTLILGPVAKHLASKTLPNEMRHDFQIVERNARLLYRHVTDLLDVAKLDADKMVMHYAEMDWVSLIRFVASHFEVLAEEKHIQFTVHAPPSLFAQIDSEKCQRILLNLVSNAFKFTPKGGTITLTLRAENDRALIQLQDNGPGVPPNMRDVIFERFRQVDSGDNRNYGGTGLGLAIVKDFVELHAGTISMTDAPGGGALFTVTVPLKAPAGIVIQPAPSHLDFELNEQTVEELRAVPTVEPSTAEIPSHAALVLVVEDNRDMNAFIVDVLGKHYRIATAYDGVQGVAQALATHPDLIVSDMMMPHLSGDQMVAELRRHPEMRDVPVVMLTAKADDALRIRMLQQGVQDYINKPFSADELLARVDGLVQHHRQDQETRGRLAAIVESSEDAIVGKTLAGIITTWNKGAEKLFGYTAREAVGQPITILFPPERVNEEIELLTKIGRGETVTSFETTRVCKDGQHIDVSVTISSIKDESGAIVGISKIARDITERKRAENALQESKVRYQTLFEQSPDGVVILNPETAQPLEFNDQVCRQLGYTRDEFSKLTLADIEVVETPEESVGHIQNIMRHGRDDFETRHRTKQGEIRDIYVTAQFITVGGNSIYHCIWRDITERKRADEQLQILKYSIDTDPDGAYWMDGEGRFLYVNEAGCQVLGYTREELMQLRVCDINPHATIERWAEIWGNLKEKKYFISESVHRRKDGSEFPVELTSAYGKFGEQEYCNGFAKDITERKQAENALRMSEEKFRDLVEQIAEVFYIVDADGSLQYVSPSVQKMMGFSPDEALGRNMFDFIHPEDQEKVRQGIQDALNGIDYPTEFRLADKAGSFHWVRSSDRAVMRNGQPVGLQGILQDITERKRAEEMIRESEEKYHSLYRDAALGIFHSTFDGKFLDVNPALARMLGYDSPEEVLTTIYNIAEQIYAEPPKRDAVVQQALNTGNIVHIENRYCRRDGAAWDGLLHLRMIRDAQGQPVCLEGFVEDITERKHRERELQAVAQVSSALRHAQTRAEMLPVIASQVSSLINAACVALIFYDDRTHDYVAEYIQGVWADGVGQHIPSSDGIFQQILAEGKPYITNDLANDPHFFYRDAIGDWGAFVEIPLATHQKTIGFIGVASFTSFNEQDVRVLEAISNIAANAIYRASLHEQAEKSATELALAYNITLEGWAHALELRDQETEGHTRRVAQMTVDLARAMGMQEEELEHIRRGALLHDIGKMGIPDLVLLKPGTFNEREWEIMRRHPEYAYKLLSPIDYLRLALDIPHYHHEKWDGTGYPLGLRGEEIPLAARLFAVVDVWDALCHDRPYRLGWSQDQVIDFIQSESGKHFDPRVVSVFLEMVQSSASES
jgi:PAS domain S-box-containing protein